MLVGIVSDTHDHVQNYGDIARIFKDRNVGMVVHCGDWVAPYSVTIFGQVMKQLLPNVPIRGVFGNNDADIYRIIMQLEQQQLPIGIMKDILELTLDNKKIAVYHGTEESIVNSLLWSKKYHAVFRGHTHVAKIEYINGVLHLNPGAVCSYGGGQILSKVSVAVYNTQNNQAELITFDRIR